MKTNLNDFSVLSKDILFMLIDHFNYSISKINNYDELQEEEKNIISREALNKITLT